MSKDIRWYINMERSLARKWDDGEDEPKWDELPKKKASRIRVLKNANVSNRDEWESQFEWLSQMALKIKSVFSKYL